MKRIAFGLMMVLAAGFCFGQNTLIVVPLQNQGNVVSANDVDTLVTLLENAIRRTGRFDMVDRGALEDLMKEHRFQMSDWSSDTKSAQMGKVLNANYIVRGTVGRLGSNLFVTARVLDVNTTQILDDAEMQTTMNDAYSKMQDFAKQLTDEVRTDYAIQQETEENKRRIVNVFVPTDFSFGTHINLGAASFKNSEYMDLKFEDSFTFVPGVYVSLGFLKNMIALQPELIILTNEYAEQKDGVSFKTSSLLIPVLLRINFYLGRVLISGLGGVYSSVPLEDMYYESGNKNYKYNTPLGWMAGINFGYLLTPRVSMYANFRYGADIGNTSISDGKGWLEIYQRSITLFGIGIEYDIEF